MRLWLKVLLAVSLLLVVAFVYFGQHVSVVRDATFKETGSEQTPNTDDPFVLGEYYFNQDSDFGGPYDPDKASQYYRQVIDEELPGRERAWYQLGRIDFVEGRILSAIDKFTKQIQYFGDTVPNVYYMLGLSYAYKADQSIRENDDYKKAESSFLKYIEFDPTSPWPRVDLAWVYFSQGKYEDMLTLLEEGLAYNPNQAWLLNTYGLALLNTGNPKRALEEFEKAKKAAKELTVMDWAAAYRGNNPNEWEGGLAEFQHIIDENIKLARGSI